MKTACLLTCASMLAASAATAQTVVIDFEDLAEAFHGDPFTHQGITYRDVNRVSGVFPDGSTFEPEDGDQTLVERATFLYNDYPAWGSPIHALTWGRSYVPGDNLSIGRLSSVTMDLDGLADHISFDMVYYENGPWGGIVFRLDVLRDGAVVGGDSLTISDLGGRDNPAVAEMSVSGVEFDQVHFYATYGQEYSLPRVMIDDLTINWVESEPCAADFDGSGAADVNDLLGFLGAFRTQGPGSDFDGSGSVDVNDLLGFLGAFRAGC
jgi:hypothetical protein